MKQSEFIDDSKYFENSSSKVLRSDYLLYYFSKPVWSDIPRTLEIFVTKEFHFEVKLFWYKFPHKKRLFSHYQSNLLPESIITLLKDFNALVSINIQKLYCSREEKYSPEGISEDSYIVNHPSKQFSINMASYWTDERLFVSEEEVLFLKLHKTLEVWKDELYENITKLHP